jgi:hypothetical protein
MHAYMHTCIHAYMHALMHAFPGPSALRAPTRPPPSQPTKGGTQPPNHPYPQGGSYAWGKGGEGAAQNPGTYNKYMYIYIYIYIAYRLQPTACIAHKQPATEHQRPTTAHNRTPARCPSAGPQARDELQWQQQYTPQAIAIAQGSAHRK